MKTISVNLKPFIAILLLHFFVQETVNAQIDSNAQAALSNASQTVYSNVAIGKTATSSSVEDVQNLQANFAFDGNPNTRFSSLFTDNEWLSVDLGKAYLLDKIIITWEKAYGKDFNILFSNNGTFTDLYNDSIQVRNQVLPFNSVAGIDTFSLKANTIARYVRMQGIRRATPNGYSIWEMQVMGTTSIAGLFPVSVTNFTVSPVNNSNSNNNTSTASMLDWVTVTDFSAAGFSIERSRDAINFTAVGWVASVNAGTVASRYTFTDKQATAGKNYYRLKQTWTDGRTGYSPVILINLAGNKIVNIYPVPATDHIIIDYKASTAGNLTITLLNMNGMPVYTDNHAIQGGQQTITINRTANMAPGQYFLKIISAGNENYTEKIVLQ